MSDNFKLVGSLILALIIVGAGAVGLFSVAETIPVFAKDTTGLLDLVYLIPYLAFCWWLFGIKKIIR